VCGGCGVEGQKGVPEHCQVRGCPRCDRRRSHRLQKFAPRILGDVKHALRFETLTVPNVPQGELERKDAYGAMSRCLLDWRRLLASLSVCWNPLRDARGKILRRADGHPERCNRLIRPARRRRRFCACAIPVRTKKHTAVCKLCDRTIVSWCPCETPKPGVLEPRASVWAKEVTCHRKGWHLCKKTPDGKKAWRRHSEGSFHLHAHVISDAEYRDQGVLAELWTAATLKHWPWGPANVKGVHIRRAKGGEAALRELLKYPTKVHDIRDPEMLAEWVPAVDGKRLVQATGAWFSWDEEVAAAEELSEEKDAESAPCLHCGALEWIFTIQHVETETDHADPRPEGRDPDKG
jgi:hypothetical protein